MGRTVVRHLGAVRLGPGRVSGVLGASFGTHLSLPPSSSLSAERRTEILASGPGRVVLLGAVVHLGPGRVAGSDQLPAHLSLSLLIR